MTSDHNECNRDEEWIALNAAKDVQLIVQSATIDFVENLQPDEGVERDGLHGSYRPSGEDLLAREIENEGDDELDNCLTEYHLPHVERDNGRALRFRFTIEQFERRWISGQRQRSKGVHDQVDPEKLNGGKSRLFRGTRNG